MRKMTDADMALIRKYTNYFFVQLRNEGFMGIMKGDVESELGLAFSRCLLQYNEERGKTGNFVEATFSTYVVSAFLNSIKDMKENYIKYEKLKDEFRTYGDLCDVHYDNQDYNLEKRELVRDLCGDRKEAMLVREIVDTSEQAQASMLAFSEKNRSDPNTHKDEVNLRAIGAVYKIDRRDMRRTAERLKEKLIARRSRH